MKKAPAFLCTAALIAALLPFSALAAETPAETTAKQIPIGTQQLIGALPQCKGGAVLVSSGYTNSDGRLVCTTYYTCDSDGRILSTKPVYEDNFEAEDCSVYYTYDADGRLISFRSVDSTTEEEVWNNQFIYDAEGRLQSEKRSYTESANPTFTYGDYDENGNPLSRKSELGAEVLSYDKNGWFSSVSEGTAEDPMISIYTRDSYGNYTEQSINGNVVAKYVYTYDSFGNILTKTTLNSNDDSVLGVDTYTYAEAPAETPTEMPAKTPVTNPNPVVVISQQKLTVDGNAVDCQKYNIDGANYFKLRDLAYLLKDSGSKFNVGYDAATNTVTITKGEAYVPAGGELEVGADQSSTAVVSQQVILIDGEKVTDLSVFNIGGSNYFKLRDLGEALGFGVDYNAETNTAIVTSAAVEDKDTAAADTTETADTTEAEKTAE